MTTFQELYFQTSELSQACHRNTTGACIGASAWPAYGWPHHATRGGGADGRVQGSLGFAHSLWLLMLGRKRGASLSQSAGRGSRTWSCGPGVQRCQSFARRTQPRGTRGGEGLSIRRNSPYVDS